MSMCVCLQACVAQVSCNCVDLCLVCLYGCVASTCWPSSCKLPSSSSPTLLHRDLKPANLMIGGSYIESEIQRRILLHELGTVKIADFGEGWCWWCWCVRTRTVLIMVLMVVLMVVGGGGGGKKSCGAFGGWWAVMRKCVQATAQHPDRSSCVFSRFATHT